MNSYYLIIRTGDVSGRPRAIKVNTFLEVRNHMRDFRKSESLAYDTYIIFEVTNDDYKPIKVEF